MIMNETRKQGGRDRKARKQTRCGNCNKNLGKSEGFNCIACDAITYCGADCQRAHWKSGHKKECAKLAPRKLDAPTGDFAHSVSLSMVSGGTNDRGSYRKPQSVNVDEKFVVKVQAMGERTPILVYDETRTCEFSIEPQQPGFHKILTETRKEKAWEGRKTFMKASFDESGCCTVYPATAGVKAKYSW
jgi:hypothetical protein